MTTKRESEPKPRDISGLHLDAPLTFHVDPKEIEKVGFAVCRAAANYLMARTGESGNPIAEAAQRLADTMREHGFESVNVWNDTERDMEVFELAFGPGPFEGGRLEIAVPYPEANQT
jgi:hypothetical protein